MVKWKFVCFMIEVRFKLRFRFSIVWFIDDNCKVIWEKDRFLNILIKSRDC